MNPIAKQIEDNCTLFKGKTFSSNKQVMDFYKQSQLDLLKVVKYELEIRIGMLRQWLNEDVITDPKKLINNDDIKNWLELSGLDIK